MYKIFINDKPFFISNSKFNIDTNIETVIFDNSTFDNLIQNVKSESFNGVFLVCENEDEVFELFAKNFKMIEAAGGLVFNNKNELLLIERLGVWDLPKGKIDAGETPEIAAIREVEEECAVNCLSIENLVCKSYHTFTFKGKNVLKRIYWYKMNSTYTGILVPQFEENITKVEWKYFTKNEIETLNTYESIKEVLRSYFV
jgi:ADP-ribose pyrophosphatase YjhB (NUDIX family)